MDWEHTLDGLALFASRERSAAVLLPFRVKPRAMIDETFATRDLVYSFNRAPPYRVLVLGHKTRLYDAWTTVLDEHTARPFPMIHRGPGGASKLPGGKGINRSAVRDQAVRTFFRSVSEAVDALPKANPLPLVVVGVERNLAFYRDVTRQPGAIIGLLAGNHDKTSPRRARQVGLAGLRIGGNGSPDGGPGTARSSGQRRIAIPPGSIRSGVRRSPGNVGPCW